MRWLKRVSMWIATWSMQCAIWVMLWIMRAWVVQQVRVLVVRQLGSLWVWAGWVGLTGVSPRGRGRRRSNLKWGGMQVTQQCWVMVRIGVMMVGMIGPVEEVVDVVVVVMMMIMLL